MELLQKKQLRDYSSEIMHQELQMTVWLSCHSSRFSITFYANQRIPLIISVYKFRSSDVSTIYLLALRFHLYIPTEHRKSSISNSLQRNTKASRGHIFSQFRNGFLFKSFHFNEAFDFFFSLSVHILPISIHLK